MAAYYNEMDSYAAQWLRNLIAAGHIAPGDVDERDVREVNADDLREYTQCHFFAGVGGWSVALRLAGWPDDRSVWTGSCPCQPYSKSGKGAGQSDERHLWPDWSRLIKKSKPAIIFGEQVARSVAYGWWDEVAADLEKEGYAVATAVLSACSAGPTHNRERLWFVADRDYDGQRLLQEREKAMSEVERSSESGNKNEWPPYDGVYLLVDGVLARASKVRAYGNAITPQIAAEFIKAATL